MNKIFKYLLIIPILLIILTILLYPSITQASFTTVKDSFISGNNLLTGQAAADYYNTQVFTATSTYYITGISLPLYKWNNCDPDVTVCLMELTGTGSNIHETGNILSSGTKSTISFTTSQNGKWESFSISPSYQINSGTQYGIALKATHNIGTETPHADVVWLGTTNNGYATGGLMTNGYGIDLAYDDLYFKTFADYYTTPSISTYNYTSNNNIVTLNGKINSFGRDNQVNTGFEYGLDNTYGNSVSSSIATINNTSSYKFYSNIPIDEFPVGTTFHYRAFMDGVNEGSTYGEDRTFILNGNSFSGRLTTLDATNVSYTSATINGSLDSLGSDTSVDLEFTFGTTTSMTETPIVLATGTTNLGSYTSSLANLTSSTTYYYEIKSIGENDGTIGGGIKSFTTWDPNKPPGVNKGDSWLNKTGLGVGFWWIILAVLMGIPWIALHDGKVKQIVAVVIDLAVLGGALALGIIDKWLFILLILGAGFAVIAMIWRHNRE